jgi:hypothetical protein
MRRKSKTKFDESGKAKTRIYFKPPRIATVVKIPNIQPRMLENISKWSYDSNTGEAVVHMRNEPELRFYDPMDLFQFGMEDLESLKASHINCGAGHSVRDEATLFARAAVRAVERLEAQQVLSRRINTFAENVGRKRQEGEKRAKERRDTRAKKSKGKRKKKESKVEKEIGKETEDGEIEKDDIHADIDRVFADFVGDMD